MQKPWSRETVRFNKVYFSTSVLQSEMWPFSSPKLPSKRKLGGNSWKLLTIFASWCYWETIRVEVAIQVWPERETCTLMWDGRRMTKERWREGGCRNDSSTLQGKCSLYSQARVAKETKAKESVLRNWWTCGWEHHRPIEGCYNMLARASQAVFILMQDDATDDGL